VIGKVFSHLCGYHGNGTPTNERNDLLLHAKDLDWQKFM
jgi:hypothetical protein